MFNAGPALNELPLQVLEAPAPSPPALPATTNTSPFASKAIPGQNMSWFRLMDITALTESVEGLNTAKNVFPASPPEKWSTWPPDQTNTCNHTEQS